MAKYKQLTQYSTIQPITNKYEYVTN